EQGAQPGVEGGRVTAPMIRGAEEDVVPQREVPDEALRLGGEAEARPELEPPGLVDRGQRFAEELHGAATGRREAEQQVGELAGAGEGGRDEGGELPGGNARAGQVKMGALEFGNRDHGRNNAAPPCTTTSATSARLISSRATCGSRAGENDA